jgi:hypothetical protein
MFNFLIFFFDNLCGSDSTFNSWVSIDLPLACSIPIHHFTFIEALLYLSLHVLVYQAIGIEINLSNLLTNIFSILNINININNMPDALLDFNNINYVPALICFLFLHSNGLEDIPFLFVGPSTFTGDIFTFSTNFMQNLVIYYSAFVPANHTLIQNNINTSLDLIIDSIR